MTSIAAELGVPVDDLCAWIMKYREPTKPKVYHSPRLPALPQTLRATHSGAWGASAADQRLKGWERARKAAREARGG